MVAETPVSAGFKEQFLFTPNKKFSKQIFV